MKRRTALIALGALASGSGAVATTASIVNSADTNSELSIIVDERIEARAGKAFTDDGSVKSSYENQYVPYESNESFFNENDDTLADIDTSQLPVATVNRRDQNINEDVKLQVAFDVRRNSDTFTFENILEVENYGGESKNIGIEYDRQDGNFDPNGQYGEQVNFKQASNDRLTAHDVREVYKFLVPARYTEDSSPERISPPRGSQDSDPSHDEPAIYFSVDPGQTLQIDLKIDLTNYAFTFDPREAIEAETNKPLNFNGTVDLVDMLDAITIKTEDA